ncbi:MAG: hypothetical protein KBC73_23270 [Burkholderiaceae bacterium]|nr:hypothetical protein [Burkholderiaceae bacterium]
MIAPIPAAASLPQPLSRLQLAQRIHDLLLAEIGHSVQIERLLAEPRYARDVLLVCEACVDSELPQWSQRFREALPAQAQPAAHHAAPPAAASPPGHARQSNDWAADTSGFGLSRPPGDDAATPERRRAWLQRWRR